MRKIVLALSLCLSGCSVQWFPCHESPDCAPPKPPTRGVPTDCEKTRPPGDCDVMPGDPRL